MQVPVLVLEWRLRPVFLRYFILHPGQLFQPFFFIVRHAFAPNAVVKILPFRFRSATVCSVQGAFYDSPGDTPQPDKMARPPECRSRLDL